MQAFFLILNIIDLKGTITQYVPMREYCANFTRKGRCLLCRISFSNLEKSVFLNNNLMKKNDNFFFFSVILIKVEVE